MHDHRSSPRTRAEWKRWTIVCAVVPLVLALTPLPVAAEPARQDTGGCTLSPSGSIEGTMGHGSCLQVTTKLDRAPAVGQTAQLRITVLAQRARDAVRVEVDLPSTLAWASQPSGLTTAPAVATLDVGRVPVQRASNTLAFAAGADRSFTATVRAVRAGYTEIRARAVASARDQGSDIVSVTIGAGTSAFGHHNADDQATTPVPAGTRVETQSKIPFRPVPTKGLPGPRNDDGTTALAPVTCATGRWTFLAGGGVRPSRNLQVQVWDDDSLGDDLLGTTLTDGDGRYRVCFDNNDGPFNGGQDVFVRFIAENGQWNVERERDEPLTFTSNTVNNVGNGSTTDFGTLQPADNALNRGLHAFDSASDASAWTPGDCWDARDSNCSFVHIRWAPNSTVGTFYCPTTRFRGCEGADNTVRLLPDDPNEPAVVVHELGHAVMDDVYDDQFPDFPNCENHAPDQARSAGCAWVEGFANWYAMAVLGLNEFRGWPLETQRWGDGWPNGDTVEGRVSGALLDISDANNEPPWDRYTEGAPGRIWDTLLAHRSATFREFWDHRVADRFDAAPERALGCLFQNTIQYDAYPFRDPMADGTVFARPEAFTAHNYRVDTTRLFWSVVAIRPEATNDHDLSLYDDVAQTQLLDGSLIAGDTIDFVGVNSNADRRPLGDYYPRVTRATGTGGYSIQYVQATLLSGTDTITMQAGQVVAARDVLLTAGTPVTITVTPSNAGQDPELFLLGSSDSQITWTRSRGAASASSTGNGPGAAEQFTFTPTDTGFHAVVVTNRAGSGTYTLTAG